MKFLLYSLKIMILTYNAKINFQSTEDRTALIKMLEAQRDAFNFAAPIIFGKKLGIKELHSQFYYPAKEAFPNTPAQVLIVAERECLARYKTIKSNGHEVTAPICKKALSTSLDKRLYAFKGGRFKITTLEDRISVGFESYPKLDAALAKYPICDPSLFVRGDTVFISLKFNVPSLVCQEKTSVGVDLGIKRAATLSNGVIFKDKAFSKRKRSVRFLKRTMDSVGTKSARRHLKMLRRKERNMNKNQSHLLANAILSVPVDVFVLEDLSGIKKKNKGKKFNNKLSQVPFFALRTIMEYKALTLGKRTITVSPRDTSKTDNRTGRKTGTRKGSRYFCKNGTVLDADINAAINIAKRGHLPFSCHSALDGQGVVKRPIVIKPRSVLA